MTLVGYDPSPSPPPNEVEHAHTNCKAISAPDVALPSTEVVASLSNELTFNPSYSALTKPAQGPLNPNSGSTVKKNILTGSTQEAAISHASFATNHRYFIATGEEYGGQDLPRPSKEEIRAHRSKRQKTGDPAVLEGENAYKGPWATYRSSLERTSEDESATEDTQDTPVDEGAGQQGPIWIEREKVEFVSKDVESTTFHGESERDYLGRTYMHVPQDLDMRLDKEPMSFESFLPKKKIHEWVGHTKGVSVVRLFPSSGHLLLSGGMDCQVLLWDTFHERSLLRTFEGHSKAIRDVAFSSDGAAFLSASLDKSVKIWSTETGQITHRFDPGAVPYCLTYNPLNNNEFLVGTADKRILQYDIRSGEIVQQYNHHLSAVNTLTFCDAGRRFISTSDDKSLRAWDYSIPTPIKYVAEPYMHSLTSVAVHPSDSYFIAQSMDNQILVFAVERFRQHRRKGFRGHSCSGYQIQCSISPDGKWVSSGDTGGYMCFWDWKTSKMIKKIKAHEGPANCLLWHPQETSKVISAGADGTIRYWD